MQITRHFTNARKGPFADINWESRKSEINKPDGTVIYHNDNVVVPSEWSQIATDILAQKYFRKAGVPLKNEKTGCENDARQVFHRLAHTWTEWGKRTAYFDSEEDAKTFYDEVSFMLAHQMAAPNSPQWFNTGLHSVYGIEGPAQGHYYVDPADGKVKKSQSAYERPQPHACFILDIRDDLVNEGGIIDLVHREARLFKYGSGTGSNFSRIRGKNEPLSGGGVSSGLLSFLKIADRSASAIKSGGTTRRAAKMVTLDADHPDIEEYIQWKVREEYKVASLTVGSSVIRRHVVEIVRAIESFSGDKAKRTEPEANPALRSALAAAITEQVPPPFLYQIMQLVGQDEALPELEQFSTDWDDDAYLTVSGQSSNNSVRLTTEFMRAVLDDAGWDLRGRTDGEVKKTVKARNLWNKIALAAWRCADPGLQYHSTINEWHTCPRDGEIRASNPCSEYMFLDDTACNLASLNLLKFYDIENDRFKIDDLLHAIRLWTLVLEISIVMAQFPSKEIARKSYDYRTLGLGFANLGSLLMVMGIPYDSDKGRGIAGGLSAIISAEGYAQSARIAAEAGSFPAYRRNREEMLRVIRNHRRAAYAKPNDEYEDLSVFPVPLDPDICPPRLLETARSSWDEALNLGETHGYRNAQISAIAPTGTIGLVMDCDTTGVEPDYALIKYKKLAGGGYFKIINQSIPPALEKLGYSKAEREEIIRYCLGTGVLKDAPGISNEKLRQKGFADRELKIIEKGLHSAVSLRSVFHPRLFDPAFLEKTLSLPESTWSLPGFDLLRHLGFSEEDILEAEDYACGTMSLEGAPHLKNEHLSVFDTANPSGRRGRRSIRPGAHIEMMAAVQPFVSGSISKTINMPSSATVDEVKDAYISAWQLMLKSIALYRDGSKLSQPLHAISSGADGMADSLLKIAAEVSSGIDVHGMGGAVTESRTDTGRKQSSVSSGDEEACPDQDSLFHERRGLPNRRSGYTQKAKIGSHSLFLRTGEYKDGRLGEIFLDMHKEGAAFRSLLNSFAIAVSLGLQYGVPLEEYVDAFTFTRFEPNGIVRGHDNIKMSTSVLDFIFRDLALSYLGRTDLVQVSPEDLIATGTNRELPSKKTGRRKASKKTTDVSVKPGNNAGTNQREPALKSGLSDGERLGSNPLNNERIDAKIKGYEGDPCPTCGNFTLIRNGTCLKCATCGSTTGCS